jgi:hypothetical protein
MFYRLLKMLAWVLMSPVMLLAFTCAIGISVAHDATKPRL